MELIIRIYSVKEEKKAKNCHVISTENLLVCLKM